MNLSKITQDFGLKIIYSIVFLILVGLSINYYLTSLHNYLMTVNNGVQIEFMIYTFLFLIGSLGIYVLYIQDTSSEKTEESPLAMTKEGFIVELVKGVVVGFFNSKNSRLTYHEIKPIDRPVDNSHFDDDDEIGIHT